MIDKQFFDTFWIKPKKGCTAYDKFTEEESLQFIYDNLLKKVGTNDR